MKICEKGQGATEYLLMLAAVLVIVAIAVYYVTTAGAGYPAISAISAKHGDNEIRINVSTGSIPANEWAYSISSTEGSYSWTTGTVELKAPYVSLGEQSSGTYYVSLKHVDSGHLYFYDQTITIS
ncbi:MAG: class III signal peptide-containing protein [Candidatus Hadarchaeaceae archaeon]